jgi:hypothetical protein
MERERAWQVGAGWPYVSGREEWFVPEESRESAPFDEQPPFFAIVNSDWLDRPNKLQQAGNLQRQK